MKNFEEWSEKDVYFFGQAPEILANHLSQQIGLFSIIDLGCGDGTILYSLYKKGLLKNAEKIVGVDLSERRIRRMSIFCPFVRGLVANVCNLGKLDDSSFDIAISSQVIEHVSSDTKMLREVYRILKPKGILHISSVLSKNGFWIYRNNGFKLDPTHVREYKSKEEFVELIRNEGFEPIRVNVQPIKYPITDLIIRGLIRINLIKPSPVFYLRHRILNILKKIKLRVPGYQTITVLARARK